MKAWLKGGLSLFIVTAILLVVVGFLSGLKNVFSNFLLIALILIISFIIGSFFGLIIGTITVNRREGKRMPTWIKSGFIVFLIHIILTLFVFAGKMLNFETFIDWKHVFPLINYTFISSSLEIFIPTDDPILGVIILGILNIFFYFIIGAIIGYIIGKLKSKKQQLIQTPVVAKTTIQIK